MDTSRTSAGRWPDHRVDRRLPAVVRPMQKSGLRRRLGCADVARNRAVRYARRHRIRKALWPLIAAAILIGLIFERRPLSAFSRMAVRSAAEGGIKSSVSIPDEGQDIDRLPDPGDTGGAARGISEPRYRPPYDFLTKDVAQALAFLIRNRGRLDSGPVRAKWDIVDRVSLPLAIYLRQVEASAAWDDLEKEIAAIPPGTLAVPRSETPKSIRQRKILRLLPEWARQGEELLAGEADADEMSDNNPTPEDDDEPDTRPRKP